MTLRERIAAAQLKKQLEKRIDEQPRLCSGCGIDLPTTVHWDDCEVDLMRRKAGWKAN
jgi:hypothetical protein